MQEYRSKPRDDVENALEIFETYQEYFIEAALNPFEFSRNLTDTQKRLLGGLGAILQKMAIDNPQGLLYHEIIASYKSALVDPGILAVDKISDKETRDDLPRLSSVDIALNDYRQKEKKLPAKLLHDVNRLKNILNYRVDIKPNELPNTKSFTTITLAEYIIANKDSIEKEAQEWYGKQDTTFAGAENVWQNRKHLLTILKNAEDTGSPYLNYDTISKLRDISIKSDSKEYQSQVDTVITQSQQTAEELLKTKPPYSEIPRPASTTTTRTATSKSEEDYGGLPIYEDKTADSKPSTSIPETKSDYGELPVYKSRKEKLSEYQKIPDIVKHLQTTTVTRQQPQTAMQTESEKQVVREINESVEKLLHKVTEKKGATQLGNIVFKLNLGYKSKSDQLETLTEMKNKLFALYNQLMHLKDHEQLSDALFKASLVFINESILMIAKNEPFHAIEYQGHPVHKFLLQKSYHEFNKASPNDIGFTQLYQIIDLIKKTPQMDTEFLLMVHSEAQKLSETSSKHIKNAAKFLTNETERILVDEIRGFEPIKYKNEPVKKLILERFKVALIKSDSDDPNRIQLIKVFELIRNMPNFESAGSIEKTREELKHLAASSKTGFFKPQTEINKAAASVLEMLNQIIPETKLGPQK